MTDILSELKVIDSEMSNKFYVSLSKEEFRDMIIEAEANMNSMDGTYIGKDSEKICPIKHSFGDGCYIREMSVSAGTLVMSKIHNKSHPYFLLKGKAYIRTEEGIVLVEAPYQGITQAGTKRVAYILEDMVWTTVHVTDSTDLDKIEDEIISKSFEEFDKIQKGKEDSLCHGSQQQ